MLALVLVKPWVVLCVSHSRVEQAVTITKMWLISCVSVRACVCLEKTPFIILSFTMPCFSCKRHANRQFIMVQRSHQCSLPVLAKPMISQPSSLSFHSSGFPICGSDRCFSPVIFC